MGSPGGPRAAGLRESGGLIRTKPGCHGHLPTPGSGGSSSRPRASPGSATQCGKPGWPGASPLPAAHTLRDQASGRQPLGGDGAGRGPDTRRDRIFHDGWLQKCVHSLVLGSLEGERVVSRVPRKHRHVSSPALLSPNLGLVEWTQMLTHLLFSHTGGRVLLCHGAPPLVSAGPSPSVNLGSWGQAFSLPSGQSSSSGDHQLLRASVHSCHGERRSCPGVTGTHRTLGTRLRRQAMTHESTGSGPGAVPSGSRLRSDKGWEPLLPAGDGDELV